MFCVLAGTRPDPPPNDWHPRQGESRTNFLAATSVNHHLIMMMMMVMMMRMMIATSDDCGDDEAYDNDEVYVVFDDWLPPLSTIT